MSSRILIRLGWVLLLTSCVNVRQCQPISCTLKSFVYAPHRVPRVFVFHRPLHPAVGETIEIFVEPELEEGRTVERAFVTFAAPEGSTSDTEECEEVSPGQFRCEFTAPATPSLVTYSGGVMDDLGDPSYSSATYRLQIGPPSSDSEVLFPVRVPLKRFDELTEDFRLDVALVRDPSQAPGLSDYGESQFEQDLERALYQQLLEDPAYRWRDNQVGFYIYTRPGFTRPFTKGLNTRCGQNPWPNDPQFPSALQDMEVVGVMHRRGPAFGPLEGEGAGEEEGAAGDEQVFRDCAGMALRNSAVRTFSAHGGKPATWQHELGHAAFGLGDEYWESEVTRKVRPLLSGVLETDLSCCCLQTGDPRIDSPDAEGEGGFGVEAGSVAGIYCIDEAGAEPRFQCGVRPPGSDVPVANPCSPQERAAVSTGCQQEAPPHCGESPIGEDACPPLRGDCVLPSAWLGGTPPDPLASQRPNVFVTLEECHASVSAAADHPGVEVGDTGIGKCVQLCGMEGKPCPCGDRELWVADVNPVDEFVDDLMATNQGRLNLHGGTCDWCIETSLCIRWQRALGRSEEDAWIWCQDPPEGAP